MFKTIILALLMVCGSFFPANATIYTYTGTIDLDSGSLSVLTTQTTPAYLRQIAVNFSAAPEAAETIVVTAVSSAGSNYDVRLATAVTVAATTTSMTFIVGTPIQIDNTHQVKVTVTNASQSTGEVNDDPNVYASILLDTVSPTGSEGVTILRDGVLLSSTRYPSLFDEASALVQRGRWNFTGDLVTCSDNATQSRTDCTIGDKWAYVILGTQFTTDSDTPVNVTGLAFTPGSSVKYEVRGHFLLRTTDATVGPQPGIAYPGAGVTDATTTITCPISATAVAISNGNFNAAHTCAATSAANNTQSFPAVLFATLNMTTGASGAFQVTLQSEVALTSVSMEVGSWIAYRLVN